MTSVEAQTLMPLAPFVLDGESRTHAYIYLSDPQNAVDLFKESTLDHQVNPTEVSKVFDEGDTTLIDPNDIPTVTTAHEIFIGSQMLLDATDRQRPLRGPFTKKLDALSETKSSTLAKKPKNTKKKNKIKDADRFESLIKTVPNVTHKKHLQEEPNVAWPFRWPSKREQRIHADGHPRTTRFTIDELLAVSAECEIQACTFTAGRRDPFDEESREFRYAYHSTQ